MAQSDFDRILTDAVGEFAEYGYDSADRLTFWMARLRESVNSMSMPESESRRKVTEGLAQIYETAFSDAALKRTHGAQFRREALSPKYRGMLNQRVLASADLIKLNRGKAIETTLSRFSGWASSVPEGGSRTVKRNEIKGNIAKPMRSQTYEERRCLIDQGHKMLADIHQAVADDQGAIAMEWRSHWRQPGYNYRPDHKERDGKVYLLRDSWAKSAGLVKPGSDGYYEDTEQVSTLPFCRCSATFLYALRRLPADMLTEKGRRMLNGTSATTTNDAA